MPTTTPVTVTRWPSFAKKQSGAIASAVVYQQPPAANRIQAFDRPAPPDHWSPSTIRFFRQLWSALHTRALVIVPGTNDLGWLEQFSSMIPCGTCRNHWKQMMLTTPPTWHDYFGWTWQRHEEVNRRLGKSGITLEQARTFWRTGTMPPGRRA